MSEQLSPDQEELQKDSAIPNHKGFTRFRKAAYYSSKGFIAAYRYEEAFRLELFFSVFLVPAAFFLPVTKHERIAMIATIIIVLIVEILNTGIEAVVDRIGYEKHELAGRAKDMGSAAVFLSIVLWAWVWGSILLM